MIAELAAMRQQQDAAAKAAAEAQRQAMIDAQDNAARQGMSQSSAMANQNLMRQQEYQKALDAAARQNATQQASVMGQSMTGGMFDVNAMNQAKTANLGTSTSYVPKSTGQAGADAKLKQKEAEKAQMANSFGMPSVQGLTFGGS